MFKIGDRVVYPAHGAGIIACIEEKFVDGTVRQYYRLEISSLEMQVLVPVDKASCLGLRYLTDDDVMADVLRLLSDSPIVNNDKWNKRYRINMAKLKSGDILQTAEVVRNLLLRNNVSALSLGEKRLLDQAKAVLNSELAMINTPASRAVQAQVAYLANQK